MSELMPFGPCPLCARAVDGKASLPSLSGGTQRAYMCPSCGFFAVPAELSAALMGLPLERRAQLAAKVAAQKERPYTLRSEDLAAPTPEPGPVASPPPRRRVSR